MFKSDVMTIFSSFMPSSVLKQNDFECPINSSAHALLLINRCGVSQPIDILRKLVLETCNHVGQRDLTCTFDCSHEHDRAKESYAEKS